VNKTLKRIVFFCCSETLVNRLLAPSTNASSYLDEGMTIQEVDDEAVLDVDRVSEQDDDDEDDVMTSSQHYNMMLSSGDASSEVDFDLDPSSVAAGGIPVSTV
jgi:hypothetical protein